MCTKYGMSKVKTTYGRKVLDWMHIKYCIFCFVCVKRKCVKDSNIIICKMSVLCSLKAKIIGMKIEMKVVLFQLLYCKIAELGY